MKRQASRRLTSLYALRTNRVIKKLSTVGMLRKKIDHQFSEKQKLLKQLLKTISIHEFSRKKLVIIRVNSWAKRINFRICQS
jgi:hypothetical protein